MQRKLAIFIIWLVGFGIGFGFIALGMVSVLKNRRHSHEESTHH